MDIDITRSINQHNIMRYSRHLLLNGFDLPQQEQLLNAKVIIVGMGGLGCASAQYLVASGLGMLTMVDYDCVDVSNLHRQILHTDERIGMQKTTSAKQQLSAINPHTELRCVEQKLTLTEMQALIAEHHLVLDCTDNIETRRLINQACVSAKTSCIVASAIAMQGQLMTFLHDADSACYQCVYESVEMPEASCAELGVLSPLVGIIGNMQALESIKLLCAYSQHHANKISMYDAHDNSIQHFSIQKRSRCSVCSKR